MTTRVLDTNVILVANAKHEGASEECVLACIAVLKELMANGVLAIDDTRLILFEYQRKTSPNRGKGPGDVFVKWLLTNIARQDRVHLVAITSDGNDGFVEFPHVELQERFDASDRKFVAVAHAHPDRPSLLQASDCKWLDWWSDLKEVGLTVQFLCPDDICRFYRSKFPDKPIALPA